MKPAMIPWEIRGRRLVDGALHEQHVAVGFGPTAKAAIAWARRNEPAQMSSFPDADIRAIPDPVSIPLPVVSSLLASLGFLACVCAADGGQTISAGFSETHPDARATRAGAGMVAAHERTGFESQPHKTAGPADSISVASGTDRKRPHSTEPWLSPDSEGAQSERAVSHGWSSSPAGTSPTENSSPSPEVFHDGVGLSADLPSYSTRGMGYFLETFTEQSPGVAPWEDTERNKCSNQCQPYSNAQHWPVNVGNSSLESPVRGQTLNGQQGGPVAPATLSFDRDLWAGIGLALGAIGTLVIAGIRLDRLDREEGAMRVRCHWNNLSTPTPGAECVSQPSADSGTGERRGFSP